MAKQIKPLPYLAIKLIFFVFAQEEGIIKSPSFSLFSSSTKMNILFFLASLMIDSIDEKLFNLGLSNKDLIIIGFSQGTMMGIQYAASQQKPINGVLGYSGRIYDQKLFLEKAASSTKIKLLHGNSDEIVPVEEMYKTVEFLKKQNFNVDYKVYQGLGHSISPEGLSDGLNFIKNLN